MTFRFLGEHKKTEYVRAKGVMLGTRIRSGRRIFLYMVDDFFVEVTYQHDDIDMMPEHIETFSSLSHLNDYLENDFRATAF